MYEGIILGRIQPTERNKAVLGHSRTDSRPLSCFPGLAQPKWSQMGELEPSRHVGPRLEE